MLKAGENCLNFPVDTPTVDFAPFEGLKPFPGEYWAVLDPPRAKTLGGVMLRVMGDGWNDKHTESLGLAEKDWQDKCDEAVRRIRAYKADPKSLKAKRLAFMASEIAMNAYEFLQKVQEPEAPGAALEYRSDAYTIVAVGEDVPFSQGDRVLIAPYAARRFQRLFDTADVVLVGLDDPWPDVTVMIQNQITRVWEPVSNWVAVKLKPKPCGVERKRRTFYNSGTIVASGPCAQTYPGQEIALHSDRKVLRPDNTKWFSTKFGPWDGQGVMLVQEVDSDGVRRVLGVIEAAEIQ